MLSCISNVAQFSMKRIRNIEWHIIKLNASVGGELKIQKSFICHLKIYFVI